MENRTCAVHKNKLALMKCNTCVRKPDVCTVCISTAHQGHVFVQIEDPDGKINQLEQEAQGVLRETNDCLEKIGTLKEQEQTRYAAESEELSTLADAILAMVQRKLDAMKDACKSRQEVNLSSIREVEETARADQQRLQSYLENDKKHTFINEFDSFVKESQQRRTTLHLNRISLRPDFRKFKKVIEELLAFGEQEETVVLRRNSHLHKARKSLKSKLVRSFLGGGTQPVESVFLGFDGFAWLVIAGSNSAQLVNFYGDPGARLSTLELKRFTYINDIMCTRDKRSTLFCCTDHSIRKYAHMEDECRVMFHTRFYPTALCEHSSLCCMLICHPRQRLLTLYNHNGHVLRQVIKDTHGMTLFKNISTVRGDKSRGIYAVIEHSPENHVIVLNSDFDVIYRYYGFRFETKGQDEKKTDFLPTDVCFDRHGHLLLADAARNVIVMVNLSNNGTTILMKFQITPTRLGVQSDGHLWAGCNDGSVQIVRY